MQAIILAAGMGKRLKALTAENTKCMVRVNGVTLIERMLAQLDALGLDRIVMVAGYHADRLRGYVESLGVATPVEWVYNDVYDKTNNIYSLYLASGRLAEDDTLLLESDLIFEDGVLRGLVDDPRPTLALVDGYEAWMDGTVVKLDGEDRIRSFVPGRDMRFGEAGEYYKTVNIYKFSRSFSEGHYVPFLEAYVKALGLNEYYEQVLRVIALVDDTELRAKRLSGQRWYEIDDLQDLDIAESIFAPTEAEGLEMLQGRYGGYWRYPHLTDFCYLVNPHYPPRRLLDEMRASFDGLVGQYPSGMRVNSLLAAKTFGVDRRRVAVGNGAAELIKSIMESFAGEVGFVRPTFEEYPNRYDPGKSVVYVPADPDFRYSADDLVGFFGGRGLEALVLINPDNPTGNYLPRAEVERVMAWAEGEGVRLVYDESFSDFADEPGNTFLDDALLARYPHAVVVKSVSKSFGVPGLRLGVLCSADEGLVGRVRADVGIWNVNSLGEFYLQIAEKYRADYEAALGLLREDRRELAAALSSIPGVRALPSQANYLMVELTGARATDVAQGLLCGHGLLVKDLSAKVDRGGRQFLRVAVRGAADNGRLAGALRDVLGG